MAFLRARVYLDYTQTQHYVHIIHTPPHENENHYLKKIQNREDEQVKLRVMHEKSMQMRDTPVSLNLFSHSVLYQIFSKHWTVFQVLLWVLNHQGARQTWSLHSKRGDKR